MKKVLNKLINNKQILFSVIALFVLVVLCIGISYTAYNFANINVGDNIVNSGHISMTYIEPSNEYIVENALPMKDGEAMVLSDYFEFSVTTTVKNNNGDNDAISIPYEITITESEDNTLTSDQIKMYLTEVEGGIERLYTGPSLVSTLEPSVYKNIGTKVGFDIHSHFNGIETVTTKYRLRAWVDYDVDVSDWDTANKYEYKFKVNVNGEATYQGYKTDPSCFEYELNDNNNYTIVGYDYANCGNGNVVVPEMVNNIKIDTIDSLIDVAASQVSSNNDFGSVSNLNNHIRDYKTNLSAVNNVQPVVTGPPVSPGEVPTINSLVVPDSVSFEDFTFFYARVNKLVTSSGKFPLACFQYTSDGSSITITDFLCNGTSGAVIPYHIDGLPVQTIGDSAFRESWPQYNRLERVHIPDSVLNINSYAFAHCHLKTVTLSNNLVTIGDYAFLDNYLINLKFPSSLTTIGRSAFRDNNLHKVSIPNGITTIDEYSFYNNNLVSVEIPESVTYIDDYAFYNNEIEEINFSSSITHLGSYAFAYNNLKSVEIPDSIVDDEFYDWVFAHNNITEFKLSANITEIPRGCFAYNNITKLEIPSNITVIGMNNFEGNGISELIIPDHISRIEGSAFANNKIRKLKLHDNITYLGGSVFSHNELTEVEIPKGIDTLWPYVFGNNKITHVTVPANITELSGFNDNFIKHVDIPGTVKTIGKSAFANNQIESYNIANGVKIIEEYAFSNNKITDVVLPDSVGVLSGFDNNKLKNITIPPKVYRIGRYAFANTGISSIELPSSLNHIYEGAFSGNNLTTVTIPESVSNIQKNAFYKDYDDASNVKLTKIVNTTGRSFDWKNILRGITGTKAVTGSYYIYPADVKVVAQ